MCVPRWHPSGASINIKYTFFVETLSPVTTDITRVRTLIVLLVVLKVPPCPRVSPLQGSHPEAMPGNLKMRLAHLNQAQLLGLVHKHLAQVDMAQLVALAAVSCGQSKETTAKANGMLVPRWAVDEILLSPDLLACIMAPLSLDDGAVAAVSKVWAESWANLLALRRLVFRSRPSRLQMSEPVFGLTTMPDGTVCFVGMDKTRQGLLEKRHGLLHFKTPQGQPAALGVPLPLRERTWRHTRASRVTCVRAAGDSMWLAVSVENADSWIYRVRVSDGQEMRCCSLREQKPSQLEVSGGVLFTATKHCGNLGRKMRLSARDARTLDLLCIFSDLRPEPVFAAFGGEALVISNEHRGPTTVYGPSIRDGVRPFVTVNVYAVPKAVPADLRLRPARTIRLPERLTEPEWEWAIAKVAVQNGRLYLLETHGYYNRRRRLCSIRIMDMASGAILQELCVTNVDYVFDMNIDGNTLRVLSSTGIRREQSELLTLKVYDELPTLCMAAEAGDTSMVQQLLAAGADATRGLPAAVARGDTALVSMLLAAGANVQNVLSGGDRRLMDLLVTQADGVPTRPVAMEAWLQGGGEGVVRSLLAARAEPTPALFPAAEGDEFEVVRMLLASVPDGEDTGLELATEHGEGLVRMLLEAGADVASSDGFGLLEAAASAGDAEAVQLLLDGGASGSGADTLAAAMQAGAPDVVRKLLDAGAVPGEPDGLVLFAVQEGDAELLQRLLSDLPVDVDAQDARGMSALHHAADGGELEICELLLDAGAHCDRSRLGYCPTPRQFAKRGGHDECVELLRNAEGVDDASDYDSDSKSDSEEDESGGRCAPSFAASCEGDTTGKKLKLRDMVVIFGLEAASARPLLVSRSAHGHGLCLYLQGHALRWHAPPPVRAPASPVRAPPGGPRRASPPRLPRAQRGRRRSHRRRRLARPCFERPSPPNG